MKVKRLLSLVLIACLVFSVPGIGWAAGDEGTATLKIAPSTNTAYVGGTLTVTITAEQVSDLYGIQFTANYDPAKLVLISATPKNGYTTFEGTKINAVAGTVMMPLLRQNQPAVASSGSVTVAELQFRAAATGDVLLSVSDLKAVSSVPYVNAGGYKDLTAIAIAAGASQMVTVTQIYAPGTPGTSGTPGGNADDNALAQLGSNVSANQQEQALSILSGLLSEGTQTLTAVEQEQLQQLVARLQQQLLSGSDVQQLQTVDASQLQGESGNTRLTFNYDPAAAGAHKLGIYVWNAQTSSWDYVRQASKSGGKMTAEVSEPGVFAVMEYTVDYNDLGKVYAEAKHAIEALTAMHLMNGTGQGQFSPAKEITRAEFVVLLVRLLDLQPAAGTGGSFADVNPNAWYADAVAAAKSAGLVRGDGTNFKPMDKLSREAMVVMLMNANLLAPTGTEAEDFADDDSISGWAKEAVYLARQNGLVKGTGNNILNPQGSATRADTAVMLLRLIEQR